MLTAEMMYLRDDVAAGRRRLHLKTVCQSVREATTASGVDNAASPELADTAERDYFAFQEAGHYYKNNWKEPRSILMSNLQFRLLHIDGQLVIIVSNTRASSGV